MGYIIGFISYVYRLASARVTRGRWIVEPQGLQFKIVMHPELAVLGLIKVNVASGHKYIQSLVVCHGQSRPVVPCLLA